MRLTIGILADLYATYCVVDKDQACVPTAHQYDFL